MGQGDYALALSRMEAKMTQTFTFLPGARVMTRDGTVATVTHEQDGVLYGIAHGDRVPRPIRPVCDAFGGEHDSAIGLDMPLAACGTLSNTSDMSCFEVREAR